MCCVMQYRVFLSSIVFYLHYMLLSNLLWLCGNSGQAGDENVALKFPGAEKEREAKPLGGTKRACSEVTNGYSYGYKPQKLGYYNPFDILNYAYLISINKLYIYIYYIYMYINFQQLQFQLFKNSMKLYGIIM